MRAAWGWYTASSFCEQMNSPARDAEALAKCGALAEVAGMKRRRERLSSSTGIRRNQRRKYRRSRAIIRSNGENVGVRKAQRYEI
jgi:hypothetical protein